MLHPTIGYNMKVKVYWKSINPFRTDPNSLGYTKIVEIPDNTKISELKDFTEDHSKDGYKLDKIEL